MLHKYDGPFNDEQARIAFHKFTSHAMTIVNVVIVFVVSKGANPNALRRGLAHSKWAAKSFVP